MHANPLWNEQGQNMFDHVLNMVIHVSQTMVDHQMTMFHTWSTMFHAMVYCRPSDHGQPWYRVFITLYHGQPTPTRFIAALVTMVFHVTWSILLHGLVKLPWSTMFHHSHRLLLPWWPWLTMVHCHTFSVIKFLLSTMFQSLQN